MKTIPLFYNGFVAENEEIFRFPVSRELSLPHESIIQSVISLISLKSRRARVKLRRLQGCAHMAGTFCCCCCRSESEQNEQLTSVILSRTPPAQGQLFECN
uniref:Uncharacterized protein n=1 Tax=Caenorhabditis japonica TaxID=281687 RepID=A0A8R1IEB9_CAEJA